MTMSKFSKAFSEPFPFSDGTDVLDGEYSRDEAAEIFTECLGDYVSPSSLTRDRVRYGFPPEAVQDSEDFPNGCWYTGAGTGKGTKAVWVCGA